MIRKIMVSLTVALLLGISLSMLVEAQEAPKGEQKTGEAKVEKQGVTPEVQKWIAIAAGFGIAIAAFGGALGQGKAVSAAMEGIARNPQAQNKIFTPMIVGIVFIETLVIYALLISIMLYVKL